MSEADGAPAEIARRFLDHLEAKRLDEAATLTGPGFFMTWPGGVRMSSFEELRAFGAGRYSDLRNVYERIETAPIDGSAAVYFVGTLTGRFQDGTAFEGIRFVDRVVVRDRRVVELHAWSDMSEWLRRRGAAG